MARNKKPKRRTGPARSKEPAVSPAGDRLRPWLLAAMTALFVARPLFPCESAALSGDGLPVVMLWIALTGFWLLGVIGYGSFPVRFGPTDAAVLLLIVLGALAGVWAAMHASPRPAINMLWEWIAMGMAFLMVRQLIVTAREQRAAVAVMIALAVGLSGYGLYQYRYELPQTRAQYAADPDAAMRAAALWYPPDSPERQLFEDRLFSPEPIATFALTNSLAGYLAPWLVVLAGVAVGSFAGSDRRRLLRDVPAAACCAIPVAACLVLTSSRSGLAAAVLGFVLVGLFCRKRRERVGWKLPAAAAGLGVVLIAAAALAAGALAPGLLAGASKSLGYRLQYWQSTMRMIAEKPVLGCGPGNFQYEYTRFKLPEASEEVADPHNFLLEVWATAGTPAALALLAALVCFFWKSFRDRREEPDSPFSINPGTTGGLSRFSRRENGIVPFPNPSIDAAWHVYAGAFCGFLLALPLGLLGAAPPTPLALLLGLPLAAGGVALLHGWVNRGRLPAVLPAIGVVVLLVNLLAAGGIGMPGVAGSLWLLMGVGLNLAEGPRRQTTSRAVALAALGVAVALAIACYLSAYGPVLRCRGLMRLAQRDPVRAAQHLADAAAADPLDANPWQQLAAITFDRWRRQPTDRGFERFEQCNAAALKLVPNFSRAWLRSGQWYGRAFAASGRRQQIDKAIEAHRRAVQLYPNSALHRAQLALALKAAGDDAAFRIEADEALRLDQITPHEEKKLTDKLRNRLSIDGPAATTRY